MDMLRRSQEEGQWFDVQRKLDSRRVEYLMLSDTDLLKVTMNVHDSFGRELWFEDHLCHKHGKKVLM